MKLIEKKCPNCGANLEFKETDKSCSCSYCHRSFEIERESNLDTDDISKQFNLSELKEKLKQAKELLNSDEYKDTMKAAQKALSNVTPLPIRIIGWVIGTIIIIGFIAIFIFIVYQIFTSTK